MEINNKKKTFIGFVTIASFTLTILGALGMLICFLFMWSSSCIDVMGAGMGFIAGSIMLSSGIISLSNISSRLN